MELNALAMKRGEPAVYLIEYPTNTTNGVVNNTQTNTNNVASNAAVPVGTNGQPTNQYISSQAQPVQYNQYGNFHRNNGNNVYHPRFHNHDRRGGMTGRGGKFEYQVRQFYLL